MKVINGQSFLWILILALSSSFMISCSDDDPVVIPDCDDDCEFTTDSFDEATGLCVNTLVAPDCNDNDPYTDDSFNEENCVCLSTRTTETITNWTFTTDEYSYEAIQSAMQTMADGDTITFGAGTFVLEQGLSIDDKDGVIIIGAGMEETILDFSSVVSDDAEGIKITADNSIIANLTVLNAAGDGIKAKDCNHFSFINVAAIWDGEASEDNGAYGLYPVTSTHILMDGCLAKGASDAGLYVGQCENVIVRNSIADNNVAGFEVENTTNADVYDNIARNNTAGLLVFSLPGLPAGNGSHCRVYNNTFENNNYENFAPGGVVKNVPPGTGIMLMACAQVEVFNNTITNNNMMSIGIVDYVILVEINAGSIDDDNYISYPRGVYVHDNDVTRTNECPTELNFFGNTINNLFPGCEIPAVLWDGITSLDDFAGENSVCVQNSGDIVNLNFPDFPNNVPGLDFTGFDCTGATLPAVELMAPTL